MRTLVVLAALMLAGCMADAPDEGASTQASSAPETTGVTPGGFFREAPRGCHGEPMPEGFEDWAVERHNVTLSSAGQFTIRVPMWVYPPATTAGTWTHVTNITGGLREMRFEDQGTSGWFEVEGEGPVELRGCLQHGSNACCAEGYIYGNWSMQPQSPTADLRGPLPLVLVEGQAVEVTFEYTAYSHWCSGSIVADGTAGPGDGTLPANHQFYCT